MMAALVLAACSDPSQPDDRAASIQLITEVTVLVAPEGTFPVTVLVSNARDEAVADATVVFQVVQVSGSSPNTVLRTDTVRTDANGEATIEAPVLGAGSYEVIATVTDADIEPAVVNVHVTLDALVRIEIVPDSAEVGIGASVTLAVRGLDAFDNEIFIPAQFRSLTPDITEISTIQLPNAWVVGLDLGTGLIVAEHAGLADTTRVHVLPAVHEGLALGANHSCLLSEFGKVQCWGAAPAAGESTEMCGTSPCVRTPQLIASELRFEAIAAGGDQTCAMSEGALYCWGQGPVIPGGESTTPQRVPGDFTFTESFTVGRDHACATTVDGEAYCWGDNSRGQLGTGDMVAATMPTPVLSAEHFTSLNAGPQFTCGLTTANTVHCWGANSYGQLGRGTVSESEPLPAVVPDLTRVSAMSAGAGEHVCAGSFYNFFCWGRNDSGQFADGTTTSSATPRITSLLQAPLVTTAAATCSTDGKALYCTGAIGEYQYNGIVDYNGRNASAGNQHACASTIHGFRCWGDNSFGQLGDGTLNSSREPVAVVF